DAQVQLLADLGDRAERHGDTGHVQHVARSDDLGHRLAVGPEEPEAVTVREGGVAAGPPREQGRGRNRDLKLIAGRPEGEFAAVGDATVEDAPPLLAPERCQLAGGMLAGEAVGPERQLAREREAAVPAAAGGEAADPAEEEEAAVGGGGGVGG